MTQDKENRPAGGTEKPRKTPNTDMQAEDAGTADSGANEDTGRGTAAESAMKQTSKTDHETGSQR